MKCTACPRACGADRESGKRGFCGVDSNIYIAKTMLHRWEEPCICSGEGAGAIFFSGCNLHCIYCQNKDISRGACGKVYSLDELAREILALQDRGAACIDLVTPTHYTEQLAEVLRRVKPRLDIPVVWNSSAYESVTSLAILRGLVDIYLPDLKYCSPEISARYSSASDYFEVATAALCEMHGQVGKPKFDGERLISGVIVRHLVLPSHRKDSEELLTRLADTIPPEDILLSLMSQYTPDFYIERGDSKYKNLVRRLTAFEYDSVLKHALSLGFDGYFQERSSASKSYTPDF